MTSSTAGEYNLRGLDVDKLAKGFADEEFVFKGFLTVTPTSAREIRWYQKTSGVLDSVDTTGITASQIPHSAPGALPTVVEQSWTRQTSYVQHFMVESPWISYADIRDADPDVLATNVRDLTRAIANQVDTRIFNVVTESLSPSNINTSVALGTGWSDTTNGNPILDLLSGSKAIRSNSYDISNVTVWMNETEYMRLLNYVITVKGSSIPSFASGTVGNGVLMSIVGQKIVVSHNVTQGNVVQLIPQRSATYKTFEPITAVTINEPGMGSKIRVWEDGEAILTDPKSVHLITGC